MAKYFLTNKAVQDLSNIWNYTRDNWSEEQADKYCSFLLDVCQEVANNKQLAKKYDQITNNLLGIRANRHIIFFRSLSKNEIEVTRILHEKMDLDNRVKQ